MTPEARQERARKAAIAKAEKAKEKRNIRIATLSFDKLNRNEQRERIFIEQDRKCELCGIESSWNGKPLKFDLDHIDGVRTNESRENLRLICPNCHSQTNTYKVGNNKQAGHITYSTEDIVKALKENTSGYSAMKSLGMNPHGGNYTRIRRIIREQEIDLPYTV